MEIKGYRDEWPEERGFYWIKTNYKTQETAYFDGKGSVQTIDGEPITKDHLVFQSKMMEIKVFYPKLEPPQ